MVPKAQTKGAISFGPFAVVPNERLLTKRNTAVPLGARAFDILVALVSRPNQAIAKKDLMAQVWPDVTVGEGSLRFHIAELRKALGDGKDGARYVATLAGRGYCFVAPVSRSSDSGRAAAAAIQPRTNMPSRLTRMVGRADGVLMVSTQLAATRFVTIVGTGGVGKTTVAVAVGHDLMESFAGAVHFADLGAQGDPRLVATSLAAMLGLSIQSADPTPNLIAYLRDRRILLILDNCEHLIEAVAALAERIFVAAPQVHILATSREPLRVEGEHVYRMAPLAFPPDDAGLTAADAMTFPAVQLFVERATASGAPLDLRDSDAAIVAGICRRLDGVALAIELAAGRVEAYGLQQTAALLEERLSLLWLGQRTAPPRQKTLQATLDWSFSLLSELERVVLGRLAVFVGHFTIEAARAVVTSATVDQALVFGAIDSLVAKSMVAARPAGAMMRYRLLETTRVYALEIAADEAERADLAIRHAIFYQRWLEQAGTEWPSLSNAAERAPHLAELGNVRAALEWCFGANGNAQIGVALAAAAVPVFLAMSLLAECHRWSERAILALDDASRGGSEEMKLQQALGMSLMYTRGNSEEAHSALIRSLAIAQERGDPVSQVQLLGPLYSYHLRIGDFHSALDYAKRGAGIAATIGDPAATALSHSLLGISLHLVGDLSGARAELEAAIVHGPGSRRTRTTYLGFDHHNWAAGVLARTLWLQGHPAQAVDRVRQTVTDAASMGHPVTLSFVLNWAISIFLWTGDLNRADEHIEWFIAHTESHSFAPWIAVGRGYQGELAIRRGAASSGVERLQGSLEELHALRYEVLTTWFNIALVQGLAAIGRSVEAMGQIDESIELVEANGDRTYLPELMRIRGGLFLAMPQPSVDDAETCFMQSLELGRRQGAPGWELRTATDLAALWASRGQGKKARKLLQPVLGKFTEGFETADLKVAGQLLATLG